MSKTFDKSGVYYGEFSLAHWVELVLNGTVKLPPYQRSFVWGEDDMKMFAQSLREGNFVPPVTIGAYTKKGRKTNLIIDGQQRLTTVVLIQLGYVPVKKYFEQEYGKNNKNDAPLADSNDQEHDEDEDDGINGWTIARLLEDVHKLTESTDAADAITALQHEAKDGHYRPLPKDLEIPLDSFDDIFLGFSYIVPMQKDTDQQKQDAAQKRYFSSVFRNINIAGKSLSAIESRNAMYFLDESLKGLFKPAFISDVTIMTKQMDFVRCLALLAAYKKVGADSVAKRYSNKMEEYFVDFMRMVINNDTDERFAPFTEFRDAKQYAPRTKKVEETAKKLGIVEDMKSVICADVYYMGLVYSVLFNGKDIDTEKQNSEGKSLKDALDAAIGKFMDDEHHKKSPALLRYLRDRINESVRIYREFEK